MTNAELISFTATVASLILAILAIYLSIKFYQMSSNLSQKSTEAANRINASTEKLEILFDKLYSDTFSMMRDTVADMRKHMWPPEEMVEDTISAEIEKRTDDKIKVKKDETKADFIKMLHQQKVSDDKVSTITNEMSKVFDRAIVDSRKVEAEVRFETIRDALVNYIRFHHKTNDPVTADQILARFSYKFNYKNILVELERMKIDGIIYYDDNHIGPDTLIKYQDKK